MEFVSQIYLHKNVPKYAAFNSIFNSSAVRTLRLWNIFNPNGLLEQLE